MLRSIKLPLYPNKEQSKQIDSFIDTTRFIYNWSLARSQEYYKETGKRLHWAELHKELTQLKKQEEYKFLNNCDSKSLQQTIYNMYNNMTIFLKGSRNFPYFKSKKKCKLSYYCRNNHTHIKGNHIQLPKFKKLGLIKTNNYCNLEDRHWILDLISIIFH